VVLLWLAGAYPRMPIPAAPPLAPNIADELSLSQTLTGVLVLPTALSLKLQRLDTAASG
jgi:CP family cyanate transporter-like MFS transporter